MDAVLLDPLGYLRAVAWRIRGLRVRSRHKIAGLAGKSRFAYQFWIACREPEIRTKATARLHWPIPKILPVIDCRNSRADITPTLESLPPGMQALVLGNPSDSYSRVIESIGSLLELEGDEVWICPIFAGDRLARGAFSIYAEAIARAPQTALHYGDDDLIDGKGERAQPHFKPDWNPELFEHHDFLTGACLIRCGRGDLQNLHPVNWANALVRRALERSEPQHVHHILHHRRFRPQPILPQRPADLMAGHQPSVTVIVPTRDRADLLQKCIDGLDRTDYPDVCLLVVDNESHEPETVSLLRELENKGTKVIRVPGAFNFSALNNRAVDHVQSDLLCFLNNDIEMINGDWLALLVRQAIRPEIGAVGARLLYPDGTLQHAGVFTGIGGGAAHGHRFQKPGAHGYFARALLPQRVSAVTAACLVVSRDKFLAVGGFDEKNFPVAFNDVDLCLRLNEHGWQSFYEPRAVLVHHESKTRGSDRDKSNRQRFAEELAALKRKWQTDEQIDPFHHPNLSRFCEQFVIAV